MKRTVLIIVLMIIVVGIILGGLAIAKKIRGSDGVPVQVEKAERRTITKVVTAFGRLSPQVEVQITSQVIGKIEKLYISEGDTVEPGDLLVELEKTRYKAAVLSAEAALRSARAQVVQVEANLSQAQDNLRKTRSMFASKLASEDALTKAQTQVDILESQLAVAKDGVERAKASLEEARDELSKTTIVSPISGVVIKLSAEVGENVITGTTNIQGSAIMTIGQLEAMEAVVDVDEADVPDLKILQEAKIKVDAFPDTFLTGKVAKIANSAKLQSVGGQETVANFEVKISIDNRFEGIRPGMSCSAEIVVARAESVISVPIQAVVTAREPEQFAEFEQQKRRRGEISVSFGGPPSRGGSGSARSDFRKSKEAVFAVRDGIAKQKKITTGIADDRYIEIKEGIEENETIVIGRYQVLRELKDNDKVKPQDNKRDKPWE